MRFFPLFLALIGCSNTGGEDLLYEIKCDFVDTEVEIDDAGPMGTSPGELLLVHAGEHSAAGAWSPSGTTNLTVDVAAGPNKAVFHELVGGEDQAMCASSLNLPVLLTFTTDDGALDEEIAATWIYTEDPDDEAPFVVDVEIDQADIQGDFEPTGVDPNEEVVGIAFHLALGGEVPFAGYVATHVEGEDDETAWDGIEEQLTWPAP